MKKFSDLSESATETTLSEVVTEESNVTFQPYMIDDPTYMGYSDRELQNAVYQSTIFGILDNTDTSILDVGCGRGDFGNYIKNELEYTNIKYTGVDLNPLAIDVGKHKYPEHTASDSFNLIKGNFDSDYPTDVRYDWVFHVTNLTVDYGNFNGRSRYEYLESVIRKSLSIADKGAVFMLLNDNNHAHADLYITFSFTEISNILFRLGYKFAFDNSDFPNVFKLVIFNNTF